VNDPIAAQLGFGRAPQAPTRRGLGTDLQTSVTAEFNSQLSTRLTAAGTAGAAQLQSLTGVNVNNARVAAGAAATVALAKSGYNPADPGSDALLIHAISGGLCLIPGVGPLLGAYVELMWQIGNAVACPVQKFFSSIGLSQGDCDSPPCASSGNWSAGGLLLGASQSHGLPPMPVGSFASFVVPALAAYLAQADNCKGGFPPSVVVDAAVNIWNATHAGPAVDLYVPPLSPTLTGLDILPHWQNATGCLPNGVCDTDPNVAYAFAPLSSTYWGNLASAPPPPPYAGFVGAYDAPRTVSVHTGAPISATKAITMHLGPGGTAVASSAPSTGQKVAIGAAVAAGSVVTSSALIAWATGESFSQLWKGLWRRAF
jgi:hypothetical protein